MLLKYILYLVDFQSKVEVSKILVDETSKKVQVTEATPSSLDISCKPPLKKGKNTCVVGNNLKINPEIQETNRILTLNTTATTKNNSLNASR